VWHPYFFIEMPVREKQLKNASHVYKSGEVNSAQMN
jgi:hypothetical protein